jgi:hypothetical protein
MYVHGLAQAMTAVTAGSFANLTDDGLGSY